MRHWRFPLKSLPNMNLKHTALKITYRPEQTEQDLKENIRICDEKEIGFSFVFPFDVDGKQIFEFAKLLYQEGFYY